MHNSEDTINVEKSKRDHNYLSLEDVNQHGYYSSPNLF